MEFHLTENRMRLWVVVIALGVLIALAGGAAIALASPFIAFGAIAAILAGAIVMSNIEFGMYALIAVAVLLPFGALPFNVGFNPTFLDFAILAVFGTWLALGFTRQGESLEPTPSEGEGFVATPIAMPIVSFMVLAVFSFISGLAFSSVSSQVLRQFVEIQLAIGLYFVIVNVIRTRDQLERVIKALIFAGFVAAALGILFYFLPRDITIQLLSMLRVFKYPTGDSVLRFIEDDPNNPMRAISTSVDPNVLGGLLILVGTLAVPQLFADKPILPRKLVALIVATMVICLILTFSRGALLGLGIALVVIATVRYRPIIAVVILSVAVFLLLPFTQDYVGHFADAFALSDRATQMRLGEYKDALNLISRYPIFGVGFGTAPDIDTYIGVSSVYLLMAEEMGLIGLGVFLLIMTMFFVRVTQAWFQGISRDPRLAPILLGIAGALLGAMIGGLTDHYFFNLKFTHSASLFWLYLGLGMATVNLKTEWI
jgi:O-antigen ligase